MTTMMKKQRMKTRYTWRHFYFYFPFSLDGHGGTLYVTHLLPFLFVILPLEWTMQLGIYTTFQPLFFYHYHFLVEQNESSTKKRKEKEEMNGRKKDHCSSIEVYCFSLIVIYTILIEGLCIAGKIEYALDLFYGLSSKGLMRHRGQCYLFNKWWRGVSLQMHQLRN